MIENGAKNSPWGFKWVKKFKQYDTLLIEIIFQDYSK